MERRRALYQFNLWNTASDINFDRIAHLAKLVFNTKGVFICLMTGMTSELSTRRCYPPRDLTASVQIFQVRVFVCIFVGRLNVLKHGTTAGGIKISPCSRMRSFCAHSIYNGGRFVTSFIMVYSLPFRDDEPMIILDAQRDWSLRRMSVHAFSPCASSYLSV